MSFEKFPMADPEQEASKESKESRIERYLAKAKRIARIGLYSGFVAMAGYGAKETIENQIAYKNYHETMSAEDAGRYESLKQKLIQEVGEDAVKRIERGDKRGFWDRREGKAEKPRIEGFEKIGLENEKISRLWSEDNGSYPKKWVNGEVGLIRYADEEMEFGSGYGYEKQSSQEKIAASADRLGGGRITMWRVDPRLKEYPDALQENLDYQFGHEIAHLNDWESDRDLSLVERAELLSRVVDRIHSERPFRSIMENFTGEKPYYERFHSEDQGEENYRHAKEYWAQISEDYFSVPDIMQQDYPEDYKLVDEYVKKNDPDFNPVQAEEQRDEIIQNSNSGSDH